MTGQWEQGDAFARQSDPATSKDAAQAVRGEKASRLEHEVLWALRAMGPSTSTEVADHLQLDKWSISPRFRPLARKRLIVDSGARRGRSIVWKAAP